MKQKLIAGAIAAFVVLAAQAAPAAGQAGREGGETPSTEAQVPTFTGDGTPRTGPAPAPSKVAAANAKGADRISWVRSFEAAKKSARPGQLIVVDVYTDWCGYCKLMDRVVYADQAVVTYAAEHVFVKLNAEDGAEGTRFARATGVRGYPTTLVFTSDGKLVARQAGAFRRAQEFLGWLGAPAN